MRLHERLLKIESIDPKSPVFHKLNELANRASKHWEEVKNTEAIALSILKSTQPPKDYKAQAATALGMLTKLNAAHHNLSSIVARWHSLV